MDAAGATTAVIGGLLLVGLLAEWSAARLPIPRVSVLILLGVAVGPIGLDLLPAAREQWFPIVSAVALRELGGGVALGVGLGVPAAYLTGRLRPGRPVLEEALGLVLLCAGLGMWLRVSYVLAAVVMGAVVANVASHHERPFREIEGIEWPFLVIFFLLAGASLELSALTAVGWIGAAYILLRTLGKVVGAGLGVTAVGGSSGHARWLGVALLPQAGVALGLALLADQQLPESGGDVLAIVVGATVVFELIGPLGTRLALERAEEVPPGGPAAPGS